MNIGYQTSQAYSNGEICAPKLISPDKRDNCNFSRTLAAKLKNLNIFPKNYPSWAADCAQILQELYFILSYKKTGKIIDGEKWVYYKLKMLAEKITYLHPTTIARRLSFLVKHGILKMKKKPNSGVCEHLNFYTFTEKAIALLEAVNPMVVNFASMQKRFRITCEPNVINKSLNKPNKENIERKKLTTEKSTTEKPILKKSPPPDKPDSISILGNPNLLEKNNAPEVDEKINTKNMANHYPNGDRNFGQSRPIEKVRRRAKMDSVLGMSGFATIEEMERCEDELIEYFSRSWNRDAAEEKAKWLIKDAIKGQRSPLIRKDFLQGQAIGTHCQEEWELRPGEVKPVLVSYLRSKLRKDKDTREQCNVKVSWYLKNNTNIQDSWNECKRLIDIEKPRLLRAIELGQNPVALKIPEWIIDAFRPEIPIEQVTETAEVLGAIADKYNAQVEQNNHKQLQSIQNGFLPPEDKNSNLYKLKKMIGLPCRDKVSSVEEQIDLLLSNKNTATQGVELARQNNIPLLFNTLGQAVAVDYKKLEYYESQARRKAADALMDKVVADKESLDLAELMPNTPRAKLKIIATGIGEINELLKDPITREIGLRRAKASGLPILYSNEGEAIAVDKQSMREDGDYQFSNNEPVDKTHYAAHKIYQPEAIAKGEIDWAAARKRLKNKGLTNDQ